MKHEEEFQPVIGPAEVRRAQMILNRYKEDGQRRRLEVFGA